MKRVQVTLRGITVREGKGLRVIQDHAKGLASLGPTKLVQQGTLLNAQFPDGAKSVVRFSDPSELATWIQARVQHGRGKFAM
ncbi:MAG: hypothetical protein Q8M09_11275 [Pseudomonadota bacterium]|jgi:hypothetical protein|nr:hypothetical protein [Pseudomonadota bacterium]MDP2352678.1 hypothetical protein [Pseudomonadota bacterium]